MKYARITSDDHPSLWSYWLLHYSMVCWSMSPLIYKQACVRSVVWARTPEHVSHSLYLSISLSLSLSLSFSQCFSLTVTLCPLSADWVVEGDCAGWEQVLLELENKHRQFPLVWEAKLLTWKTVMLWLGCLNQPAVWFQSLNVEWLLTGATLSYSHF